MTSWDDGHKLDMKLAKLLKKYKLPAIFFICASHPKWKPEDLTTEDDIRKLAEDFEIGAHTRTHPSDLKELDDDELEHEIVYGKKWLEKITGKKITKFCPPRGRYDDRTLSFLKEKGYNYSRTTVVMNTALPRNNFRIASTIHAHPNRREYGDWNWVGLAKKLFLDAKKDTRFGYYNVWGHSWEIDALGIWNEVEELFKFLYDNRKDWRIEDGYQGKKYVETL